MKLDEKELDKLIMEVLNEDLSVKIDNDFFANEDPHVPGGPSNFTIANTNDKLSTKKKRPDGGSVYYKLVGGELKFATAPKSRYQKVTKNNPKYTRNHWAPADQRRWINSLAGEEVKNDEFDIKDVIAYLTKLKNSSQPLSAQHRWKLDFIKRKVQRENNDNLYARWNASISLMRRREIPIGSNDENRQFLQGMFTNTRGNRTPQDKAWWRGGYLNNLLKMRFDDNDAAELADNIDPGEEMVRRFVPQRSQSLFRVSLENIESELGNFPADINNSMKALFGFGGKNLYHRIKQITDFSERIYNIQQKNILTAFVDKNKPITPEQASEFLASSVLLDHFSTIVSGIDAGSGAYMFESFLAALAGGKVLGKATTEEGKMGGVDFTFAGGAKGSAKFYSSSNRAGIEQAIGGFSDGDEVHYLIALKNRDADKNIIDVDIHYLKMYVSTQGLNQALLDKNVAKRKGTVLTDEDGNPIPKLNNANVTIYEPRQDPQTKKPYQISKQELRNGAKIKMSSQDFYKNTKIGTLRIINSETSFREALISKSNSFNVNVGAMIGTIDKIVSNSDDMKTNLNQYVMGNDASDGDKAVGSFNLVKDSLQQMFDVLTKMGFKKSSELKQKIKENKEFSDETLDKMIQEVILTK